MKLLHTSDWHVGKTLRGRSRAAEHVEVLGEIASIAEHEAADLVVVAGDLFDTAAPTPESERIVYDALLSLTAERTRPVVVIAGNHDSAHRLAAVAPVFAPHGVTMAGAVRRADDGGVLRLDVAGDEVSIALLPFASQRNVVHADELMTRDAGDIAGSYAERVKRIVAALTESFSAGGVNLVLAHLMVMGGTLGGGERSAHTIFDYWVPAAAFPPNAHYVALGHLHRAQRLEGASPLHYCGSPLQLDFGETANDPSVNVVDARPGTPASVRQVALRGGRRLRTLQGSVDALVVEAAGHPDDHLRLVVDSAPKPGLADELRERVPNAVEVLLAAREVATVTNEGATPARLGRSPHELFGEYLAERGESDRALTELFAELLEEAVT